ncbi:hypothetical protein [Microbacterium sp. NPDC091676]|uniref:phage terminase small subunit n=1 Tax=Microbacterium sp. NPDC091676 TaxID=3364212 RepID=UPI003825FF4D
MPGKGRPPKNPAQRARRNKDVVELRVVEIQPTAQPKLPTIYFDALGKDKQGETTVVKKRFTWPKTTQDWWAMLARHPLAVEFTELDWAYLAETAMIHAQFWKGDVKLAGELRLREAKYGFTPEDRARLRMSFALATGAEADTATKVDRAVSARERMRGITRKDTT